MTRFVAFVLVFLFLLVVESLKSAVVSGKILDPKGNPLPSAEVMVEKFRLGTTTNSRGEFKLTGIPEGEQILRVYHISYSAVEKKILVPVTNLRLQFDHESLLMLDEIVVSATRTPKTLKDSPLPVMIIPAQTIEERQAVTVSDALEHVPGIVLMPNGFTRNSITLHGLPEQYSLLLLDGQRIYGRHADAKDLDHLSAGMISRIELVKGPSSVLYGSDAVAGVVNVITKIPQNVYRYEIYGSGGSDGQYNSHLSCSGKTAKLDNLLFAGYNKSGGMVDGFEYTNLNMRYNGNLDLFSGAGLRFGGGYFIEESEEMPSAPGHEEGGPYLTDEVFDLSVGFYNKRRSEGGYKISAYFYSQDRWDNRPGREDRRWDRKHVRLESILQHSIAAHEIVLGWEGRFEFLDQTLLPEIKNQRLLSVFGQYTWALNRRLSLVTAARVENHDKWGMEFVPRLGLAFDIQQDINIRLSGGSSYRAPTLEDLYVETYYHPWGGGFWLGGNPDLKPEKGIGANLDLEWIPDAATVLTVDFFYTRLTDRISSIETDEFIQGSPVQKLRNFQEAKNYGLDIQLNKLLLFGMKANLFYGYINSEDKLTGDPFEFIPKHKGGVNFLWKERKRGTLFNLNITFLGERASGNEVLGKACILDLNIEQRISGGFSVFVAGDNLLDEELYPSRYINQGRFYRTGIRFRN